MPMCGSSGIVKPKCSIPSLDTFAEEVSWVDNVHVPRACRPNSACSGLSVRDSTRLCSHEQFQSNIEENCVAVVDVPLSSCLQLVSSMLGRYRRDLT